MHKYLLKIVIIIVIAIHSSCNNRVKSNNIKLNFNLSGICGNMTMDIAIPEIKGRPKSLPVTSEEYLNISEIALKYLIDKCGDPDKDLVYFIELESDTQTIKLLKRFDNIEPPVMTMTEWPLNTQLCNFIKEFYSSDSNNELISINKKNHTLTIKYDKKETIISPQPRGFGGTKFSIENINKYQNKYAIVECSKSWHILGGRGYNIYLEFKNNKWHIITGVKTWTS